MCCVVVVVVVYAIVAVAVASVFCSAGLRDYKFYVCCFWDQKKKKNCEFTARAEEQ